MNWRLAESTITFAYIRLDGVFSERKARGSCHNSPMISRDIHSSRGSCPEAAQTTGQGSQASHALYSGSLQCAGILLTSPRFVLPLVFGRVSPCHLCSKYNDAAEVTANCEFHRRYFGKSLSDEMLAVSSKPVPLGLIHSSIGGTTIQQWMPPWTTGNDTCLNNNCGLREQLDPRTPVSALTLNCSHVPDVTSICCTLQVQPDTLSKCTNGSQSSVWSCPSGHCSDLWHGMIAPFVNMTIKAAIWYVRMCIVLLLFKCTCERWMSWCGDWLHGQMAAMALAGTKGSKMCFLAKAASPKPPVTPVSKQL